MLFTLWINAQAYRTLISIANRHVSSTSTVHFLNFFLNSGLKVSLLRRPEWVNSFLMAHQHIKGYFVPLRLLFEKTSHPAGKSAVVNMETGEQNQTITSGSKSSNLVKAGSSKPTQISITIDN